MAFKVSAGKTSGNKAMVAGIIILGTIIFAAVGGVAYNLASAELPDNVNTLCPGDGPLGHVVLLVDKSDPMTFTQRKDFDVLYEDVVTKVVSQGHLLSIYALGDDFASTSEPLLELCNPGDGSGASGLDANPTQMKKAFDKKYLTPMLELREDLVTDQPGKASPILEMVQLAGITGFRKHAVQGEKRLILVSDMIQNTPQLKMYTEVPKYELFAVTSYGRRSVADLKGVKVEFRMLLNTPTVQNEDFFNFWRAHVKQGGGRLVLHEPIKG